jgi:hypothetical protein
LARWLLGVFARLSLERVARYIPDINEARIFRLR